MLRGQAGASCTSLDRPTGGDLPFPSSPSTLHDLPLRSLIPHELDLAKLMSLLETAKPDSAHCWLAAGSLTLTYDASTNSAHFFLPNVKLVILDLQSL